MTIVNTQNGKFFLPAFPSLTDEEMNAAFPANGTVIYNSTWESLFVYARDKWSFIQMGRYNKE